MSDKEKGSQSDFGEVISQFTQFLREKAETDDDVKKNVLPAIENLNEKIQESLRFQEEYPTVASLLSGICATMEEHHSKLELLKDVLVDHGMGTEVVSEKTATEQALASWNPDDKDLVN